MVANFCYGPNRQAARELCRRVLPQVRGRLPAAVLRFVGAGFPDELRGSGVEAPGYVPELLPEYARAGVVLAPLTTGGGIKIKVVEALAAGRPLVATAQAMHGIEYRDLAGVTVVDLEGFAAATVAALEASPPDLGGNWERVQERFGARRQAARLIDRIDAELGDPPPAVPATREDRGI
jgi:glycosyltransferase involved in cell wall biosynthesis